MIPSNVTITTMDIHHIDSVHSLNLECFSSEAWSKKSIEYELSSPHAITLIAEVNGDTVGFLSAKSLFGECYINNIGITKSYRRQGIAVLLLSKLIQLCTDRHDDFITLEVRVSNTSAISLYSRFNFEQVGKRKDFYTKPTEDALLLTLNLK